MDDLARQIKEYAEVTGGVLSRVAEALSAKEYGTACSLMSSLTQAHADTTLKMRNLLIRKGLVGGSEDV